MTSAEMLAPVDRALPGMYRAKVESVADPENKGRVRARVYPFFAGIDAACLPWAIPAMPLWCGAGTGTGMWAVPVVGSMVWVFFEAESPYQPVYFAEAQDGVHGLPSGRSATKRMWQLPCGVVFSVDDSTKEVLLQHPAGTTIRVQSGGEVQVQVAQSTLLMQSDQVTIQTPKLVLDSPDITATSDIQQP